MQHASRATFADSMRLWLETPQNWTIRYWTRCVEDGIILDDSGLTYGEKVLLCLDAFQTLPLTSGSCRTCRVPLQYRTNPTAPLGVELRCSCKHLSKTLLYNSWCEHHNIERYVPCSLLYVAGIDVPSLCREFGVDRKAVVEWQQQIQVFMADGLCKDADGPLPQIGGHGSTVKIDETLLKSVQLLSRVQGLARVGRRSGYGARSSQLDLNKARSLV